MITIVPNAATQAYLREVEIDDWAKRENSYNTGKGDPGRRLPYPPGPVCDDLLTPSR